MVVASVGSEIHQIAVNGMEALIVFQEEQEKWSANWSKFSKK